MSSIQVTPSGDEALDTLNDETFHRLITDARVRGRWVVVTYRGKHITSYSAFADEAGAAQLLADQPDDLERYRVLMRPMGLRGTITLLTEG